MSPSVRLAVGLLALVAIAVAVLAVGRVRRRRAVLAASARALVQLTFVALALRGVFAVPGLVVLVLVVMFSVATWTAMRRRREEVEAWLSLGATPRQAVVAIARDAAAEALVPALDQTRTVGLVTLPGAFVGALLGGASAVDAARFQIVVLIGLLCAQSITAVTLAWLLGAPRTVPVVESEPAPR